MKTQISKKVNSARQPHAKSHNATISSGTLGNSKRAIIRNILNSAEVQRQNEHEDEELGTAYIQRFCPACEKGITRRPLQNSGDENDGSELEKPIIRTKPTENLTNLVTQRVGSDEWAIQRTEADTQALCPIYYRYDTSRPVNAYNCAGLAHRTYILMNHTAAMNHLLSQPGRGISPSTNCRSGEVKHWFWNYNMHFEDHNRQRVRLGTHQGGGVYQTTQIPASTPKQTDFHTVAGVTTPSGNDPTDVYSKNGRRPVYGPSTGPSFRPPNREHSTLSNSSATPMYDTSGNAIYKLRSNMSTDGYCVPCLFPGPGTGSVP